MTAVQCFKCGASLEAGARFCGACGSQQPGAMIPQAAVRSNAKTMFQGGATPVPSPPSGSLPLPSSAQSGRAPQPVEARPQPPTRPLKQLPQPPADVNLTGKLLNNRYLVEEKIGEGGFGAVYRATQTQMSRKVALKVLHAKMATDQQVVSRFKREAQASSALHAPHTVQVYDFDQSPDGIMYLAMEMLEGRSLHDILFKDGPISPERMIRIMDGIADSLGEAHAAGIVHRDIKPENIFLETRPTPDFVKVLDFGIAKIVSGDRLSGGSGPALTAAGQTLGTLEYMSPEQLMGAQLDGRSDLYALGILSYEMIVGELPFICKTPGEMITAHLKTLPAPPSARAPERKIPHQLDRIILKLMAKKREDRFRDAADLRAELARVADGDSETMPQISQLELEAVRTQSQELTTPLKKSSLIRPAPISSDSLPRLGAGNKAFGKGTLLAVAGLVVAVAAVVVVILLFLVH